MKKILLTAIAFLLSLSAFALPGEQVISDTSGEYIYFEDNTFKTETYIGFLYYNPETYAIRYYSPLNKKTKTQEKSITLYLTVDSTKEKLSITGEYIVGASEQEDTEIVNYLHDLFYELTERRKKVSFSKLELLESEEEFLQFGGDVIITYNPLAPIFNIQTITSKSGTILLNLRHVGLLSSSGDKSFEAYTGNIKEKDQKRTVKKQKTTPYEASYSNTKCTIDTSWTQNAENFYLYGNNALLMLNSTALPKELEDSPELFMLLLFRKLATCPKENIIPWHSVSIKQKSDSSTEVSLLVIDTKEQTATRVFHTLIKNGNSIDYAMLSVFDGAYQKDRSYYNSILESIR